MRVYNHSYPSIVYALSLKRCTNSTMDTEMASVAATTSLPEADSKQARSIAFIKSYLDKILRVTVTDGRVFVGTFKSIDQVGAGSILSALLALTALAELQYSPSLDPGIPSSFSERNRSRDVEIRQGQATNALAESFRWHCGCAWKIHCQDRI